MAEVLFVLVTVYVVYVVHSIVSSNLRKKGEAVTAKNQVSVVEAVAKKEPKLTVTEKKVVAKKPVAKKAAVKKSVVKKPVAKKTAPAKTTVLAGSLRNPETGEVTKIASQYRMTKRWIKEALVAEGLLEKIYKTKEIDDAAKVKINKALAKMAKMDKYL